MIVLRYEYRRSAPHEGSNASSWTIIKTTGAYLGLMNTALRYLQSSINPY